MRGYNAPLNRFYEKYKTQHYTILDNIVLTDTFRFSLKKIKIMSAIGAAAIAGASSLIGSGLSTAGASKMNKRAVDYAREARREDIKQWHLQNYYNSPTQQMQRLREAGLNPNLVYGNGGGTIAATSAPPTKVPELTNTMASMEQLSAVPALSAYQDMRVKNAQIANTKALTELTQQKKVSEVISQGLKASQTARNEYNLGLAKNLEKYTLETAIYNVQKTQRDIALSDTHNRIMQEMQPYNIADIKSKLDLRNVEKKVKTMEYDYQKSLRDIGLPYDTPWWAKSGYMGLKNFSEFWSK